MDAHKHRKAQPLGKSTSLVHRKQITMASPIKSANIYESEGSGLCWPSEISFGPISSSIEERSIVTRRSSRRSLFTIFVSILAQLLLLANQISSKGLVGKLPGNPASCPEEPCNSDPQQVLYALKWASLFFGCALMCPLFGYGIYKLYIKLELMCTGGKGKSHKGKPPGKSSVVSSSSPSLYSHQKGNGHGGGIRSGSRQGAPRNNSIAKSGSGSSCISSSEATAVSANHGNGLKDDLHPGDQQRQQQEGDQQWQRRAHKSPMEAYNGNLNSSGSGANRNDHRNSYWQSIQLQSNSSPSSINDADQTASSTLNSKAGGSPLADLFGDLNLAQSRQLTELIINSNAILHRRQQQCGAGGGESLPRQQQHRYSMFVGGTGGQVCTGVSPPLSAKLRQAPKLEENSPNNSGQDHTLKDRYDSDQRRQHRQQQRNRQQQQAPGNQSGGNKVHPAPELNIESFMVAAAVAEAYKQQQQHRGGNSQISLANQLYHQQQQLNQPLQQLSPNTLGLPSSAAQHRHSIDGSVLNNMAHGMEPGLNQVNSFTAAANHNEQSAVGDSDGQFLNNARRTPVRDDQGPSPTRQYRASSQQVGGVSQSHHKKQRPQQHYREQLQQQQQDHLMACAPQSQRDRRPSLNAHPS